eukprot:SAG22_NODE_14113_length_384_cov_0.719298_1_plen_56_part_01
MKSLESHLSRMHATNVVQEWDGTFKGAIAKLEAALTDYYGGEQQVRREEAHISTQL